MLIKTVKWVDPFTGEERTRDFYFHVGMGDMSRAHLEYGFQGGLEGVAKEVAAAQDAPAIIALFEKLVAMAYGRRTEDGDFVKTQKDRDEFIGGRAYDALFYELVTDSAAAAEFLNAVMPDEVRKKVKELQKAQKEGNPDPTGPSSIPEVVKEEPVQYPGLSGHTVPVGKATVTEHQGGLAIDVMQDKPLEPKEQGLDPFRKPLAEYTYVELTEMPYDDFDRLMRTHKGQLPRALLNLRYQRDLAAEKR